MAQSIYGGDHPHFATASNNLAALYHAVGRRSEAERLYRQALAVDLDRSGKLPDPGRRLGDGRSLARRSGDRGIPLGQLRSDRHLEPPDGTGALGFFRLDYTPRPDWFLRLAFEYQGWSTDPGVARTYATGAGAADTRFNEANWEAFFASLGFRVRF